MTHELDSGTKNKRLLAKHRKGCLALRYYEKGVWVSPWVLPTHIRASKAGTVNKGWDHWILWICNDSDDCPARLITRQDIALAAAGEGRLEYLAYTDLVPE